jgi:hypothetical protein
MIKKVHPNNCLTLLISAFIIGLVIWAIYRQINEHYLQDDPILKKLKIQIEPLFKSDRYYTGNLKPLNDRDIMKEIKFYRGDKSYTINKQKVYICLKDEKGNYYSLNLLCYVVLHEISHVLCNEVGHTQKFHDIFEDLLQLAISEKIYNPSIPVDPDYCEKGDHSF